MPKVFHTLLVAARGVRSAVARGLSSNKSGPDEFRTVTALRGIASLAVCLFHIGRIGGYGWTEQGFLGVQCFFVISGFVIPYALHRAAYREREFFRYLARRAARIDPPYLVSIILTIGVNILVSRSPWYQGPKLHYTAPQIAAHLGYVNNFLGFAEISSVYWTLGIEFQYYIVVGLFCGALLRCDRLLLAGIVAVGVALNGLPFELNHRHVIFQWTTIFLMGITVASHHCGVFSRKETILRIGALYVVALFAVPLPEMAHVALATALLILFVNWSNGPLDWLGNISYSLYLVHAPVGERLMKIGPRLGVTVNPLSLFLWFVLSVLLTMLIARAFQWAVEEPAKKLARRVNYHPNEAG